MMNEMYNSSEKKSMPLNLSQGRLDQRFTHDEKLNQPPKGGTIGDFGNWMDKELYPFTNQEAQKHFEKISDPSVDRSCLSNFEQRELSTIDSLTTSTALGAAGVAIGYTALMGVSALAVASCASIVATAITIINHR